MPILCYTTKNRRRKRARGSPLDPSAERIFEMRSVGFAIKKQRADIPNGRSALSRASSRII